MKFDVLICARSGSKGIKNKNIKKIGKRTLLENTILTAKKIKKINKVFVSTDSKKYMLLAKKYGAEVPFLRPKKLSGDKVAEWKVWEHFVKKQQKKEKYLIILPTTSPFRYRKDILKGINLYEKKNMMLC